MKYNLATTELQTNAVWCRCREICYDYKQSVLLLRVFCQPVARGQRVIPRHSVTLPAETFVMRKRLLTLPLTMPKQKAEAIWKICELYLRRRTLRY